MPIDYAGNTLEAARSLTLTPTTQMFNDYVDRFDTNDYYKLTLSGRSSFNLSLDDLTGNANVQLLNSSNQVVQSSAKWGKAAEAISVSLDSGTYYIRVYPGNNWARSNYTLGVSATPQISKYNFTYYYNGSSGSADYYTGTVYAKTGTYTAGNYYDYNSIINQAGANGKYYISGATTAGTTVDVGKVYIDKYYDVDSSASSFTPYYTGTNSSGTSGLGSEYNYIYDTAKATNVGFGYDYFEADITPQISKYNFTYYYNGSNGSADYYTGTVYAKTGTYTAGNYYDYTTTANETGANGKYYISGATTTGTALDIGKVYIDKYYDVDSSGDSFTPYYTGTTTSGTSGFGSEYNYVYDSAKGSYDYFGNDYGEADITPQISKYNFTYYYNGSNGSADYYTGTVYAKTGTYTAGNYYDYTTTPNQTGANGKYYISGATTTGTALDIGKVYIDKYYDVDSSGNSFTPYYTGTTTSGTSGFGSEYNYVYDSVKGSYNYFGNDYGEADITPQISEYNFTYYYNGSNGGADYYTGTVYAKTGTYTAGNYYDYNRSNNEIGANGKYYITAVTNAGTALDIGKVYIDKYYDVDSSGDSFTPYYTGTTTSGTNGLGSEYNYVYDSAKNSYDYFGNDSYEADITPQISKYNFTYYYNGSSGSADYYTGTVYARTGTYTTGNYYDYTTTANEIGANGKYYISGATTAGTALDIGKVYIDKYYDVDSSSDSFTPYYNGANTSGTSGLGSEYNYVYDSVKGGYDNFGNDYYEADITPPALVTINNLSFTAKEGDSGTFQIKLNQAPTSNVTLSFSAGSFLTIDADGIISDGTQNTITFTSADWNQAHTVWFIAEKDGSSTNRTSGNTIGYSLSGGKTGSGSYDLGTIINTYSPDTTRFNIDLDFRNDSQSFWTTERRTIAQKAADDWANLIANELGGIYLNNRSLGMVGVNGTDAFQFTSNRYIDDLVIFVGSYNGGDNAGGWGGSYGDLGGWTISEPLARAGEFSVNAAEASSYSNAALYSVFSHEIGHTLGLLGQNEKGSNLIDRTMPQTAIFKGEYAKAANGGSYVALQSQDGPSPVTGQYDYSHPANRVKSMMSYGWTYNLSAPTNIDYAMLADIGYSIKGINA
jgi:hypothetical protein